MEKEKIASFKKIYGGDPEIFSSAPGRINIIGEHTDYNQGYVLPAAIHLRNNLLASKRHDDKVTIWAENLKQEETFSLGKISFSEKNKWANYVKGIFWVLKREGFKLGGIGGLIWGDLPLDAGLSSSAALEISVMKGLTELFHIDLEPERLARLAQKAENDFVGVKCGLMDQFISVFGQKNKALFLDCETLHYKQIPLNFEREKLALLVYDTKVRRKLSSSEYNKRRQETSEALKILRKRGVQTYKEAHPVLLEEMKGEMDEVLYKRAKHVISENERVKESIEALDTDNFTLLGELLFQSHESLRDDYEVSCPELDLLYEIGKEFPACLGARLIGAGFGGSGIALLKKEAAEAFQKKILAEAEKRGFTEPRFYEVEVGEGAKVYRLIEGDREQ